MFLVFDLSAAFDSANHNLLHGKLGRQYGLTDTVFAWFESYLSSKKYYIKVNNFFHMMSVFHQVFFKGLF